MNPFIKKRASWPFIFSLSVLASLVSLSQVWAAEPGLKGRGTLLQYDFNDTAIWPQALSQSKTGLRTRTVLQNVGTIDAAKGIQASGGMLLSVDGISAKGNWSSALSSGPIAVRNTENNLGKLTLSFDMASSSAHPVVVRFESLNAKKQRTGGLETVIYPPAPDFYQRFALDLSTLKSVGVGKFDPKAPFVQFRLVVDSLNWPSGAKHELRLDNLQYAKPAFYVSASGNDQHDGLSEATAFATPRKAVDMAGPGDIVLVMNGTYLPVGDQEGIVRFKKAGTPAAWISLKNYPGHKPLFFVKGAWAGIRIWNNEDQPSGVIPAYIEVRGLHIRGEGDVAKEKYPDLIDKASPFTNGNAMSVSWSSPDNTAPHHLRYADNLVEYCTGAGIGPGQSDWVTIENNVVRNNCWTTIYGTSGISLNHGSNFNGLVGKYTMLIRNNIVSGNRTFRAWKQIGKISDGNGIIVDVNQDSKLPPEQRFQGRTLIQNNVSFNNGGSGIHSFKSSRVDIINNTVYMNSASPELTWGQLFVQQSDDVRMINNIVVAPDDQPVNTVGAKAGDQNSSNIYRANNLYFGGGTPPLMGENDTIGNPLFVNASIDHNIADFKVKAGSPALKAGRYEPFGPVVGVNGEKRSTRPDIGAYQR